MIKGHITVSLWFLPRGVIESVEGKILDHPKKVSLPKGTLVNYDLDCGLAYALTGLYVGYAAPYMSERWVIPVSALEQLAGEAE